MNDIVNNIYYNVVTWLDTEQVDSSLSQNQALIS